MTTAEKVMGLHTQGIPARSIAQQTDLREETVLTIIRTTKDNAHDYKKAFEEQKLRNKSLSSELNKSRKEVAETREKMHILAREVKEYTKWIQNIEKSVFGKGAN